MEQRDPVGDGADPPERSRRSQLSPDGGTGPVQRQSVCEKNVPAQGFERPTLSHQFVGGTSHTLHVPRLDAAASELRLDRYEHRRGRERTLTACREGAARGLRKRVGSGGIACRKGQSSSVQSRLVQ